MSTNYIISSLIGKIFLAKKHNKIYITEKKTKTGEILLKLFFKKSLIKTYTITNNNFIIFLRYKYGNSLIKDLKMISIPSKRIFISVYKLQSLIFKNNLTFYFLSTTMGILEGRDALHLNLGGEILFKINL